MSYEFASNIVHTYALLRALLEWSFGSAGHAQGPTGYDW